MVAVAVVGVVLHSLAVVAEVLGIAIIMRSLLVKVLQLSLEIWVLRGAWVAAALAAQVILEIFVLCAVVEVLIVLAEHTLEPAVATVAVHRPLLVEVLEGTQVMAARVVGYATPARLVQEGVVGGVQVEDPVMKELVLAIIVIPVAVAVAVALDFSGKVQVVLVELAEVLSVAVAVPAV